MIVQLHCEACLFHGHHRLSGLCRHNTVAMVLRALVKEYRLTICVYDSDPESIVKIESSLHKYPITVYYDTTTDNHLNIPRWGMMMSMVMKTFQGAK